MTSNHEISGYPICDYTAYILLSKIDTQAPIKSLECFVKNVYITISK